jgi:hypothetical protein
MSALKLEKQLERIPLLTKIANTESCLKIYAYLALYGKTTPAEMRHKMDLSKATIFRSLALLSEARIITKKVNEEIWDKRFQLEYYIKENIVDLIKSSFSDELQKYAETEGKLDVLNEWLYLQEFLPLTLNQVTSQMMISTCESGEDGKSVPIMKTLIFRLREEENYPEFQKKLLEFLRDVEQSSSEERDMRKAMSNPLAFSISVVAYGSESEEICEDYSIKKIVKEL